MARKEKDLPRWMRTLTPPECPAGWVTGPPDFVGVGAQRCGTSWWYRAIEQHPQVARVEGQRKELHYFGRFWDGELPPDLEQRYRHFFPRPPGTLTGEFTPRYMYDFWSLALLRRCAPDARILVLLRDPVERYLSGVARLLRRNADSDIPMNLMMFADAMARGLYHQQLSGLFQVFPRRQVLLLQYERCTQDPAGEYARTCRFLGIEEVGFPEMSRERRRPPNVKPDLREDMRVGLVARLADDVSRLTGLCPEIEVALWPNFAHLVPAGAPTQAEEVAAR